MNWELTSKAFRQAECVIQNIYVHIYIYIIYINKYIYIFIHTHIKIYIIHIYITNYLTHKYLPYIYITTNIFISQTLPANPHIPPFFKECNIFRDHKIKHMQCCTKENKPRFYPIHSKMFSWMCCWLFPCELLLLIHEVH